MDNDTIRIIVSTDNHLGYQEKDAVRGNDSFAAFEEVLVRAKEQNADFVLLAGDLFHENKPSRRTLHSAIQILQTHCFGEDPVYIEVLSDQEQNFKSSYGRVNYENPYQSISMPVFAIHGNHDDPSRDGGNNDALAALDVLAASNLVNYFGKSDQCDDIEINPVIIRKGPTIVALYGLGAIRDERLNRMWNSKKVKFVRPVEGQDRIFCIFILHQNRDYGRGKKSCVHESMIPEWMDLVIWGNEHECQPELAESLVGTFRILQQGSSIATSLIEGESMSHPKHMGRLEIREKQFRVLKIPFSQIRPFIFEEIVLKDNNTLDVHDPKLEESVKALLAAKVRQLIRTARMESAAVASALPGKLFFRVAEPNQVLVRLRVDVSGGFPTLNVQRFAIDFVGQVANPSDILLFSKSKAVSRVLRSVDSSAAGRDLSDLAHTLEDGEDDAINKIKIEELVKESLECGNRVLKLLAEVDLQQGTSPVLAPSC